MFSWLSARPDANVAIAPTAITSMMIVFTARLARRVIRISPTCERVILATRPWVLKWPTAVLAGAFAQNSRRKPLRHEVIARLTTGALPSNESTSSSAVTIVRINGRRKDETRWPVLAYLPPPGIDERGKAPTAATYRAEPDRSVQLPPYPWSPLHP